MTDGPSKTSDSDRLPPEVVQALEMGGVWGIKALRRVTGLGLYEAKLAIDEYLEQHPEHPLLQRSREGKEIRRQSGKGATSWDEIIVADPVTGEAVAYDSLPKDVAAADFYVLLREKDDCGSWLGAAVEACGGESLEANTIEIVDEERRGSQGELSAAVLKFLGVRRKEAAGAVQERLMRQLPESIGFRVVEAAQWGEAKIPADELAVEYFLHEFSRRSFMIGQTTSSVKLVHRRTGISCRSTAHRRRQRNYEEALLLLASLLKDAQ
jgi:hypothetical protein